MFGYVEPEILVESPRALGNEKEPWGAGPAISWSSFRARYKKKAGEEEDPNRGTEGLLLFLSKKFLN